MGAVGNLLAKVVPERQAMVSGMLPLGAPSVGEVAETSAVLFLTQMFSSVLPDLDPVAFALLCFLGGVVLRVLFNVLLSVARAGKPAKKME